MTEKLDHIVPDPELVEHIAKALALSHSDGKTDDPTGHLGEARSFVVAMEAAAQAWHKPKGEAAKPKGEALKTEPNGSSETEAADSVKPAANTEPATA